MKAGLRFRRRSSKRCRMLRRSPLVLLAAGLLGGCIHVKMDPIELNANVTVNVKVEKALDDFFGELDRKSDTLETPSSSSQP